MSNKNSDFQDPKPFNTISLITQRNKIKELIDAGLASQALTEMTTLVCEFDLNKKDTDMIQVKNELIQNQKRPYLKASQTIDYYVLICDYMNDTYCRGFKAPMGEDFFEGLGEPQDGNTTG